MKVKKIKSLIFLSPIVPTLIVMPLIASCGANNQPESQKQSKISLDKKLSYQYFSTFKIQKKTDASGWWKIEVDDQNFEAKTNVHNDFFSIQKCTPEELIIQPFNKNKISSQDVYTKYSVSYYSNNKCVYNFVSFLSSENKINLNIKEGCPTYFSHANPTITIEASDASTGNELKNIDWSYQLMDKSVQSHLRYFSVIQESSSTTLTLIRNDIPENTSVWVWADDPETKSKASIRLSILNYVPPKIAVDGGGHAKLNLNEKATFSVDFLSGSTTLQSFVVGWNVYSISGQPINVNPDTGVQEPITSETLSQKNSKYGNNLDFLQPECSNGQKGIKDEQISFTLNPFAYIPAYSGIQLQAVILFKHPETTTTKEHYELVSESENFKVSYDNRNYNLKVEQHSVLCNSGEESNINFVCYPYNDFDKYEYRIEPTEKAVKIKGDKSTSESIAAKFSGYKDVVNKNGGTVNPEPMYDIKEFEDSNLSPAQSLLRFVKPKTTTGELSIDPSGMIDFDHSSGYANLKIKLFNQLYLPVQDPTGQHPEKREIDFSLNVKVFQKKSKQNNEEKDKYITSFPLTINILNKNRVLSSKEFDLGDDPTILNLKQSDNSSKIKEFWRKIEPYQCELYVDKSIKTIKRTPFKLTDPNEFAEFNRFKSILKYISFEFDSQLKEISDAETLSPDIKQGVFENITLLRMVDFSNCKNLERIGNYAFRNVGVHSSGETLNKISIPVQNEKTSSDSITIGESAFENCGNLQSFILETTSGSGFNKSLVINKKAFKDCVWLQNVELNYEKSNQTNDVKIKESAFENCIRLSILNLSKVSQISSYAFWNCQQFTNLDFSNNIFDSIFYDGSSESKKRVDIDDETRSVFGYNYTQKEEGKENPTVSLNIQFANHETILAFPDPKEGETEKYYKISQLYKTFKISSLSDVKVLIGNFSGTYNIYSSQKSSSLQAKLIDFSPRKLDLYNVDEDDTISIAPAVEELTFSTSASTWCDKDFNATIKFDGDAFQTSKLRVLCFNRVGINGNITAHPTTQTEKLLFQAGFDIDQIETFVLIAPPINQSFQEENKEVYCNKIMERFFPINYSKKEGVPPQYSTWLANYSRSKILNINIKLSLGYDDDKSLNTIKTYENIAYWLLTSKRLAYFDKTKGEQGKGDYVDRGYLTSIDLNTHVSWILW